jgi:hypothetical protein
LVEAKDPYLWKGKLISIDYRGNGYLLTIEVGDTLIKISCIRHSFTIGAMLYISLVEGGLLLGQ